MRLLLHLLTSSELILVVVINFNNIRFHFRYPTVRDPYESRTVEVRESRVPGAGEGLFAVRDVGVGESVAYFAGVRVPATETSARSDYSILLGKKTDPFEVRPKFELLSSS